MPWIMCLFTEGKTPKAMTAQDRVRWDTIYRDQNDLPYPAADPILFDTVPPLEPGEQGRALDLAAGLGQNGLWMASQGYTVDIIDISRVALARARAEMTIRNLRNVNLLQKDLDDLELDEEEYHVACVFRYLKRSMFRPLMASVMPGGRIIYATFNVLYLDIVPKFNQDFLLELGELESYFEGWEKVHYQEYDHISQIVAVKPTKVTDKR